MRPDKIKLPFDWNIELLDKITDRGSGHTPNKLRLEYWNGGIDWISLSDSNKLDNRYIDTTEKNISLLGIENSSAVLHKAGTVVISRDAGVGKSAIMLKDMAVSQHFIAWFCDSKRILNNLYLYYWLQFLKPEFERIAIGSTIKTIGLPYFRKLQIPYPKLNEQEKIAKILSVFDDAIDICTNILKIKNKEFCYYIERAIKESTNSPLYSIDNLFDVGRGRVISKREIQKNDGKYPVYSSQTSNEGVFGFLNSYDFDGEYITWTTDGANAGSVFYRNGKFNCTNVCGTLKAKSKEINSLFVSYLLGAIAPKYVSKNLANPKLMNGVMKSITLNIPNLKCQNIFAEIFKYKKKELQLLMLKKDLIKNQKKGLMQQLLTGKRRVKL